MGSRFFSRVLPMVAIAWCALGWPGHDTSAQERSPGRTVLTIHWGSEDFPGVQELDAAIREVLRSVAGAPINCHAEYLETEAFQSETAATALRDYIRQKYQGQRIDAIITTTSPAVEFALDLRKDLFPDVPIIFAAGSLPDQLREGGIAGVTGVLSDVAFAETLELALHLQPSVKRVFVVAHAATAPDYGERVRSALARFSDRVQITHLAERSVPGLLAAVKATPPDSLILYTRYVQADTDRTVYSDEVARLMAEVSPVPIYGTRDLYIGTGIVGGMMRGSRETGIRVAEITRQVLDGTRPENIPVQDVPLVPTFDWRQLERWGIDTSRIPQGSDVRFRVPSVWESYRWYIVGTLLVIISQLMLIAGLLTQITRRRGAEATIRKSEATLRTSYERTRQLAGRLINAQEVARAGIAQDLHDDVCQRLVYVSMAVSNIKGSSGDLQDPATQQAFSDLEDDTNMMFDGLRKLSHDLHPATLRMLGLTPALKAHCSEVEKRHAVEVRFTTEGDIGQVPPDVALCFFRIAQESLRNGIVHGRARHLEVSLARSGEDIEVTIADDGTGFDLETTIRSAGGLGLVSMEERAHLVGGSVHVVSEIGRGTTVRVRAPAEPLQPISLSESSVHTAVTPTEHSPAAG
jgi:signal transduction histidine kinase